MAFFPHTYECLSFDLEEGSVCEKTDAAMKTNEISVIQTTWGLEELCAAGGHFKQDLLSCISSSTEVGDCVGKHTAGWSRLWLLQWVSNY